MKINRVVLLWTLTLLWTGDAQAADNRHRQRISENVVVVRSTLAFLCAMPLGLLIDGCCNVVVAAAASDVEPSMICSSGDDRVR